MHDWYFNQKAYIAMGCCPPLSAKETSSLKGSMANALRLGIDVKADLKSAPTKRR